MLVSVLRCSHSNHRTCGHFWIRNGISQTAGKGCVTCLRMWRMRPLLARAKCSGTVPFLLLRPPYCRLKAPTPMFCFMYTFLASDAASTHDQDISITR